jgi:hypothetical protein
MMPRFTGYRKRVPTDSPRMKSAQQRAQFAREGKMGGAEAAQEKIRRKKVRGMFAPFAGLPPFQR